MNVVIVTCQRRGTQHLRNLIDQIDGSGWPGARAIVADGPLQTETSWRTFSGAEYEGQMRTYWRALSTGIATSRASGGDRICILEDDVELCRNAVFHMQRVALPADVEFVSWFDGHAVPAGAPPGIHRAAARRFVCLQAVTWKVATAERLLSSPMARTWNEPHRADLLIAQILAGRSYGVHVPNLVQHCGADSICNPGDALVGLRTSANYPGKEFDALTLPDLTT